MDNDVGRRQLYTVGACIKTALLEWLPLSNNSWQSVYCNGAAKVTKIRGRGKIVVCEVIVDLRLGYSIIFEN